MSGELETRLEGAFTAQAATTTTSDDAWARIQRRAMTRDHRRSVVLRSVAAAVVGLLVVGGGVALFRDRGEPGTVATGSDASKSIAGGSRAAADASGAGEVAPEVQASAPFTPVGNGLEVQQNADGTIAVRLGSTTSAPVQPGGISAAIDGDTVFGVVPMETANVALSGSPDPTGELVVQAQPFDAPGALGFRCFVSTSAYLDHDQTISVFALGYDAPNSYGVLEKTTARRDG